MSRNSWIYICYLKNEKRLWRRLDQSNFSHRSTIQPKIGAEKFSVVGISYGGFVAYHVARMWPKRVEKVVIASSGVNMRRSDNEALLKRVNLERIEQLLLPESASQLRTLTSLAMSKNLTSRFSIFLSLLCLPNATSPCQLRRRSG